jgi:2-deoxy-D-gluconate 3-dehydrogenase
MSATAAAASLEVPALDLFSLEGKNALVTGGSRGIGAAMAMALADAGADVCIAQQNRANSTTAENIRAKGRKVEIIECDLSKMADVETLFPKALDALGGRVDILVNCGGLLQRKASIGVTEADWDYVIAPLV